VVVENTLAYNTFLLFTAEEVIHCKLLSTVLAKYNIIFSNLGYFVATNIFFGSIERPSLPQKLEPHFSVFPGY
jgi:hypothetical protein